MPIRGLLRDGLNDPAPEFNSGANQTIMASTTARTKPDWSALQRKLDFAVRKAWRILKSQHPDILLVEFNRIETTNGRCQRFDAPCLMLNKDGQKQAICLPEAKYMESKNGGVIYRVEGQRSQAIKTFGGRPLLTLCAGDGYMANTDALKDFCGEGFNNTELNDTGSILVQPTWTIREITQVILDFATARLAAA